MLFATPTLTPADDTVLGELEEMRRDLAHQIRSTPAPWVPGLRQFLTADAVASSNTIEGIRVSTVDALDVFDGERDVDVTPDERAATSAYQHMMTYIQTLHDVPDFRYSSELLNALHWMLLGHVHHARRPAGQWRRGPVYVTSPSTPSVAAYVAPDAEAVPGLMGELVHWLNDDDATAPLVRGAMAHLHLVSIHPWGDGNGRMSRSLQTLVIAREGVLAPEFSSIEGWLGRPENTWEYYRRLAARGARYRPEGDVHDWVRFNLLAHHQQAQTVHGRWERSAQVWEQLEPAVAALGVEPRTVSALHDVAMTGRVRRTRYERAEALSPQQARRDLRDLVARGVLEAVGRTRDRYYVEGPAFPEPALTTARTPMVLRDPYQV